MELNSQSVDSYKEFISSWVAYVGSVLILLVAIVIGLAIYHSTPTGVGVTYFVIIFGLFILRVSLIRSIKLYTDDRGVWVYRGIFPWDKGESGIKWRDLDDATYYPNFFSWLLKSYQVRVGHRFTQSSEIILRHIKQGDVAVMHINEQHSKVLANSTEETIQIERG